MAHVLGRADCIESLQKDLVDIQASVLDVLSRTGPVCQYSWKFPDTLSCDLDILTLLEKYDYVENEESSNQLSHAVLLELIIDRLLLLLQSLNVYVEQLRCDRGEQKSQKACRSAGGVVKSFWKNLVQFAEYKSSKETSQTTEPTFAPCDACHQSQSVLWKTGNALVDLLQSEGLPSSLQSLLEVVKDTLGLGQMTAGDVTQLANEQLRDVCRLQKHLQDVRGTVEPLQERVTVADKELDKFRSQVAEFEKEMEKHQKCNVQLDFSLRNAERALKETQQTLKEEKQQLTEENLLLEEKITSQQNCLEALESVRNVLQEKVKTLESKEEATRKHQERVQLLLDKESAKYKSSCRQQESMQVKQQSLLKKVDALDEECGDLQRRLESQEEKENNLNKQLQEVSEEKEKLRVLLNQEKARNLENQKEKKTLETNRDELNETVNNLVEVLIKREQLSVAFPEFSLQAQAQSKGSDHTTEELAPAQTHTPPQYKTVHREVTPSSLTREYTINCPSSPAPPNAVWRHTKHRPVPVQTAGVHTPKHPTQRSAPETPEPHHSAHGVGQTERGEGGEDEKWRLRARGTARGSEAQHARSVALRLPKRPRPKPPCKPWERQIPSFSLFSVAVKSGAGRRLHT